MDAHTISDNPGPVLRVTHAFREKTLNRRKLHNDSGGTIGSRVQKK
ncbi:MAG: hypothetical protein WBQ23_06040 [Bacteroidota bacterium]